MAYQEIGLRVILLGVGEFRRGVGIIRSDLSGLEREMRGLNSTTTAIADKLTRLGGLFVSTGRALTLGLTLPIVALGGTLIKAGIEYEDAFAGVSKTVDGVSRGVYDVIRASPLLANLVRDFQANVNALGSSAQSIDFEQAMRMWVASLDSTQKAALFAADGFGELTEDGLKARDAIRELALEIPISAVELANVATIAGELGIPLGEDAKILTEFTRVAALMGVATNMSAEDAANAFGRFGNIFQIAKEDMAEWSLSFGSTLVQLGNTTAGTESEISAMALRVAAAGRVAGLSEQEILAMSATMVELGIKAERGGTAFSRVLQEMQFAIADGGAQLDIFAHLAGVTNEQLTTLFDQDPTAAIGLLVTGFAKAREAGEINKDTLEQMGITGVRAIEVMTLLGLASETFGTNLDTANSAWQEQLALEEEAAKRFKTVGSQIQLAKNAFKDLGITIFDLYRDDIDKLVKKIGELITKFKNLDPKTQKTIIKFAALAAVVGPLLVLFGTFLLTMAPIVKLFGGILFGGSKLITLFKMLVPSLALAKTGVAGFAMALGPLTVALLAVSGLIKAYQTNFMGFRTAVDGAIKALKEGDFEGAIKIVVGGFSKLFEGIKNVFVGIASKIKDWINEHIFGKTKTAVDEADTSEILTSAGRIGTAVLDGMGNAVKGAVGAASATIVGYISDNLNNIDMAQVSTAAMRIGTMILDGAAIRADTAAEWLDREVANPIRTALVNADYGAIIGEAGRITASILTGAASLAVDWGGWLKTNITDKLEAAIKNYDYSGISFQAGVITGNLLSGMEENTPEDWGEWLREHVLSPFSTSLKEASLSKDENSPGAAGQSLITRFTDSLKNPFSPDNINWIEDEIVGPFLEGLTGDEQQLTFSQRSQIISDKIKEGIKNNFTSEKIGWVKSEIIEPFLRNLLGGEYFKAGYNIMKNVIDGMKDALVKLAQGVIDFLWDKVFIPIENASKGFITFPKPNVGGGGEETAAPSAPEEGRNPYEGMGIPGGPGGAAPLTSGLGAVTTTNIANTKNQSMRVFSPVYNAPPTRETVDATRSLYREWNYQA